MSVFTDPELAFLHEESVKLARLATVDVRGDPHVVPSGWTHNRDRDTIDLGGMALERTHKYRNVARTGRAAVVIDDVQPPWHPRAILVRGAAEALAGLIRIHPEHVVSWGLDSDRGSERRSRPVP